MRLVVYIFFLLISIQTFGQKTKDTIYIHNTDTSIVRVEYEKNGYVKKETYYYLNNTLKQESFYDNGVRMQSIYYDTLGIKTSEWGNPEIEQAKHRKERNQTLLFGGMFAIIITGLLIYLMRYKFAYYLLIIYTIISPIILLKMESMLGEADKIAFYSFVSSVFFMPIILFILSMYNLFRRTDIPVGVSVLFGLLTFLYSLFILLLSKIATGSMIG